MIEQQTEQKPEFTIRAIECAKELHGFLESLDLEEGGIITYHDTNARIALLQQLLDQDTTPPEIKDILPEGISELQQELKRAHKLTVTFLAFPNPHKIRDYRVQIESIVNGHQGTLDIEETTKAMTFFDNPDEGMDWFIQYGNNTLSELYENNIALYNEVAATDWTDKFRNPSFVYSFS